MRKILVVGSLNMDLVGVAPRIPVTGETIIGHKYFIEPGGKGANQAYAAAKLGAPVAMLGRIGNDEFGRRMRKNLADVRCDVTGLRAVEGASGAALVFVAQGGENSIIVVPGANDLFSPEDVETDAAQFENASIVLLQLENPIDTVLAAARTGKKRNATVILDPAPAPGRPLPAEMFSLVDILTPNETEAALLTGLPPKRLSPREAKDIAEKLQSMGASTVIMKLGDQGCLLVARGASELIVPPKVDAVDTTAAGDVFNAAVAVGLYEGCSLREACRFAVNAAALSVTRLGTQIAAPARTEVEEFASAMASDH